MQLRQVFFAMTITLVLVMAISPPLEFRGQTFTQASGLEPEPPASTLANTAQQTGILNPALMEHVGWASSGTLSALLHPGDSIGNTIPIDEEHSWKASEATAEVWNLKRHHVLNGSFDTGTAGFTIDPSGPNGTYPDGWTAQYVDTDPTPSDQIQTVGYDDGGRKFVSVQNTAEVTNNPQHVYTHSAGTRVLWNQTISVSPGYQMFNLSLDYLYAQGPLGYLNEYNPEANGNCSLQVFLEGQSVWNVSLRTLQSRGVWYSTGTIPIALTFSSNVTMFMVGLVIDDTMRLDADDDYDGDSYPDGESNTHFINVQIDDVLLLSASPPSPENVDMRFHAGGANEPVIGSAGSGSSTIVNQSYWVNDPLLVSFEANQSISFDYEVRVKSHKFFNSTSTTDPSKIGVAYSTTLGSNISLEFYMYVGFLGDYENLTTMAYVPSDWYDIHVLDPFIEDVTGNCSISSGQIEVPIHLLSTLGWWKFEARSPNYAKNITASIYVSETDTWQPNLIYRSSNITMATITIEANGQKPNPIQNANISWVMPNSTIWFAESISSVSGNEINSTPLRLDSINTTAGIWSIVLSWTNGTEVAFDSGNFEVHHRSKLTALQDDITTSLGETFTIKVRFEDAENGENIANAIEVKANWSTSYIQFLYNPLNDWYEAEFDTSFLEAGDYIVMVNASAPYHDDAFAQFTCRVYYLDNTLKIDSEVSQIEVFSSYIAHLMFNDSLGQGIEQAQLNVSSSAGDGELIIEMITDEGNGAYSVEFYANKSGSYSISIIATKPLHESASASLLLVVTDIETTLNSLNGTAGVGEFGQSYVLILEYKNSTGSGVTGASVLLVDSNPAGGLSISAAVDLGNGNYSFVIDAQSSGTFTLQFEAWKVNHERQLVSFIFAVSPISTNLTISSSDDIIAIDQFAMIRITYCDSDGIGLSGATISALSPPMHVNLGTIIDHNNGTYSLSFSSDMAGQYQISFRASLANYLDSSGTVIVIVSLIPTQLIVYPGLQLETYYREQINSTVLIQRTDFDGTPLSNITDLSLTAYSLNGSLYHHVITLTESGFVVSLSFDEIGIFDILIDINSTKYESNPIRVTVRVQAIPATVSSLPSFDMFIGRQESIEVAYLNALNQSPILDASVTISGRGSQWVTVSTLPNGNYSVAVQAGGYGSYDILLDFKKDGFATTTLSFSFEVSEIPITLEVSLPVWTQGYPFEINVTLREADTGAPISDAHVECTLLHEEYVLQEFVLEEIGNGNYWGRVDAEWFDSGVTVRINVEKDNYRAEQVSTIVDTEYNPEILLLEFTTTYAPPLILGLLATTAMVALYKLNQRRVRAIRQKTLEIRTRIADAGGLIGLIVLHKKSGLPIYSKFIRTGIDEGMLSAFLTAILHFRTEFENGETDTQLKWRVYPVSDIIRIVITENMICAFITVSSPSPQFEARMITFSRYIGDEFDDMMEFPPTEVMSPEMTMIIERAFEDYLDGLLAKKYFVSPSAPHSEDLDILQRSIDAASLGDNFYLMDLAIALQSVGVDEDRTYRLIMQVIESGYILPID